MKNKYLELNEFIKAYPVFKYTIFKKINEHMFFTLDDLNELKNLSSIYDFSTDIFNVNNKILKILDNISVLNFFLLNISGPIINHNLLCSDICTNINNDFQNIKMETKKKLLNIFSYSEFIYLMINQFGAHDAYASGNYNWFSATMDISNDIPFSEEQFQAAYTYFIELTEKVKTSADDNFLHMCYEKVYLNFIATYIVYLFIGLKDHVINDISENKNIEIYKSVLDTFKDITTILPDVFSTNNNYISVNLETNKYISYISGVFQKFVDIVYKTKTSDEINKVTDFMTEYASSFNITFNKNLIITNKIADSSELDNIVKNIKSKADIKDVVNVILATIDTVDVNSVVRIIRKTILDNSKIRDINFPIKKNRVMIEFFLKLCVSDLFLDSVFAKNKQSIDKFIFEFKDYFYDPIFIGTIIYNKSVLSNSYAGSSHQKRSLLKLIFHSMATYNCMPTFYKEFIEIAKETATADDCETLKNKYKQVPDNAICFSDFSLTLLDYLKEYFVFDSESSLCFDITSEATLFKENSIAYALEHDIDDQYLETAAFVIAAETYKYYIQKYDLTVAFTSLMHSIKTEFNLCYDYYNRYHYKYDAFTGINLIIFNNSFGEWGRSVVNIRMAQGYDDNASASYRYRKYKISDYNLSLDQYRENVYDLFKTYAMCYLTSLKDLLNEKYKYLKTETLDKLYNKIIELFRFDLSPRYNIKNVELFFSKQDKAIHFNFANLLPLYLKAIVFCENHNIKVNICEDIYFAPFVVSDRYYRYNQASYNSENTETLFNACSEAIKEIAASNNENSKALAKTICFSQLSNFSVANNILSIAGSSENESFFSHGYYLCSLSANDLTINKTAAATIDESYEILFKNLVLLFNNADTNMLSEEEKDEIKANCDNVSSQINMLISLS